MSLSINTTDLSNSGTYRLLFDYYLGYFVNSAGSKHTKKLAQLTTIADNADTPAWLKN